MSRKKFGLTRGKNWTLKNLGPRGSVVSRMLTKIDFCGATGHDHGVSIESSGGGGGSGNGGGDNNQQRAAKTAAAAIASSGGGGGGGGSGNSGGDNNQQRAAKTTVAAMVRKRRRQVMRLFF